MTGGSQPQTIEPTYQGVPASALRLQADRGPVSMVDRLKTTESVSQGARAFALSHTSRIDSACVKQLSCSIIATIQANLILRSVVLNATQGTRRLLVLQTMWHLCTRRPGVSSTAHVADRSKQLNLSARGQGAEVVHTANQQLTNS